MPKPTQTYANHRRLHPLLHLVIIPIFLFYALVMVVHAVRAPGWVSLAAALASIALLLFALVARLMVMTVQDRLIQLEMRLRLERVLPEAARPGIQFLSLGQLVSLRFASDAELPALVARTLSGELVGRNAIKQAITSWQPDHQRA